MSVVLIFQDYRYRLIMKFLKVRLRIPFPLPRLPQAKRRTRMWKKSDRVGSCRKQHWEAEAAAGRPRGLARRLGKKSLFIVFVSSVPVFLRSRLYHILEKTGERGWRKNMGKSNRREPSVEVAALNNKGLYDHVPPSLSWVCGIPVKRSLFLSSAQSQNSPPKKSLIS